MSKLSLTTQERIVFQNSAISALGGIKRSGYIQQSHGYEQGRGRRLGSYALVYSLNGGCTYRDERIGKQKIKAGDLIIILPQVEHRYGAGPRGHWDEFFIVFDGPVFDLWQEQGILQAEQPILHLQPVKYWQRRLESCLETGGAVGRLAALRQVCNLQSLLAEILARASNSSGGSLMPNWLDVACESLSNDLHQQVFLPQLADSLNVSFETFRKKFTLMTGLSPGRYRAGKVIDRACELMISGNLSGKEIAEKLGFADEYHFSKRFKQITGLAPRDFRRQMLVAK